MTDVYAALQSLQTIAQIFQQLFLTAFKDPTAGLVTGGLLILLGRAGRALTAAGVIIIAYALLTIILPQLGIQLPWK